MQKACFLQVHRDLPCCCPLFHFWNGTANEHKRTFQAVCICDEGFGGRQCTVNKTAVAWYSTTEVWKTALMCEHSSSNLFAELDPIRTIGQRSSTSDYEHDPDRGARCAEHRTPAKRVLGSLLRFRNTFVVTCKQFHKIKKQRFQRTVTGSILLKNAAVFWLISDVLNASGPSALLANNAPRHVGNRWACRHVHETPAIPWHPRLPVPDRVRFRHLALLPRWVQVIHEESILGAQKLFI